MRNAAYGSKINQLTTGVDVGCTFTSKIGEPVVPWYQPLKRGMDLFFGVFGLLMSSPIILLFAILIKATSKGPIFYIQQRVGFLGQAFCLIKLRSMRQDAEKVTGAVWASATDSRVTAVGRFMRRTRIDELPQLWNVIVGDMSLIGPRPERPNFTEKFSQEFAEFPQRLRVKPGITGYAQIHGGYDLDPGKKARLDNFYITHMSAKLEIEILIGTIRVIFTGDGAR
ncbi:sugar transferase [Levilactobacillus tujiorum]|uniref:Sugar transferase n=1 Tax=Levilactobacillus tujiorum TaxID=2912243 RepID=A0ABX1L230_9LACO|nr:sugar transferase [Levilactobacillus tujiorum]MCH5463837.1 sugar transferase [Levilactobacillus tujiorum]NLR11044.1 sugar transferase [Lactobacillus sp. HBUAS51387]NLR28758.1 sugar transferase [Levilactobacillus tujiorum]